ncbi:MAG TPA: O-antigen translocase [Caulobacteraceae bacterium]|nr:O-antigen translocase [Caulobacteraceae bacterium]
MSSRGLIKSMLVIGSAQVASILISLVRMKLLALMLGPAGVGILSIYGNLQTTAKTAAALGLTTSAVRDIARARAEEPDLSRTRIALLGGLVTQGLLALGAIWLLREPLARMLLGDGTRATEVGLVGVAVLLSMIGSSQTVLLQGMRRIADLGRVTVIGALAGTAAGLLAVWLAGEGGLIWFVLVQPLAAVLVALYFTRRLPPLREAGFTLSGVWDAWRPMVATGVVFMLGGLVTTGVLLLVRGVIVNRLGLDAAGLFAASWSISVLYVGFLLSAMSTDYYPRLAEVIHERDTANRLMNDQAQLALALGGPVLLLLIGFAPWAMSLLYSSAFTSAAEMLQWQTLGNVLKLASWPLGYALIAGARSRLYLLTEIGWNLLFLGLLWVGLPIMGITAAGVAFLIAYIVYFLLLYWPISRLHGFRWEALSLRLIGLHVVLGAGLLATARLAPVPAAALAVLLAAATGLLGVRVVLQKVGPQGRLASRLARVYAVIGWPLGKDA